MGSVEALASQSTSRPGLTFTLESGVSFKSGPRTGLISLTRSNRQQITIKTPGLLTGTSRGVISHMARDVYAQHAVQQEDHGTGVLKWVNVPWETFLEHNPPVPTLYAQHLAALSEKSAPGDSSGAAEPVEASAQPRNDTEDPTKPLHTYLSFPPSQHILSISARDPNDTREMPPNQEGMLNVATLRGVRKLTPAQYTSHIHTLHPDLIFAAHDSPFTNPPYSQKRLTKSIDRTQTWIAKLMNPERTILEDGVEGVGKKDRGKKAGAVKVPVSSSSTPLSGVIKSTGVSHPPILAPLLGSTSPLARTHYSNALLEPLYGPELEAIQPYKCIDEGISGYYVELANLRRDLEAGDSNRVLKVGRGEDGQDNMPSSSPESSQASTSPNTSLASLLTISLDPLPTTKPRIAFGVVSPHDVLRLIRDVGIDIVDADWGVRVAGVGVGFHFAFPVDEGNSRREIGHNFYDTKYTYDFAPIASSFKGASQPGEKSVCWCLSCSPRTFDGDGELLRHGVDSDAWLVGPGRPAGTTLSVNEGTKAPAYNPPHTRAYIHHLLHTHEMSAHALLVSHNLAVIETFLRGIRDVLRPRRSPSGEVEGQASVLQRFEEEVKRFEETYEELGRKDGLVERAAKDWREVERARGKGRLGREKEKEGEED